MQQSSQAAVAIYGEESGNGFGDRRGARSGSDTLAFDSSGNFFMSLNASNNNFIRKFSANGTFIKDFDISDTTLAAGAPRYTDYRRLAVDSNDLVYAIEILSKAIHVFDSNGVFQTIIPTTPLNATTDITFDHDDNYYLTDSASHRIRKYTHNGTFLYYIGGPTAGSTDGMFNTPGEVAVDSHNNLIVADTKNGRIQMFNETGAFIRKFGQKNTALYCPAQPSLGGMGGLTVDQQDNIYVSTRELYCNRNIHKFDNNGIYLSTQIRPRTTSYMRTSPTNVIYNVEHDSTGTAELMISTYATDGSAIEELIVGKPDGLNVPDGIVQDSLGNTYVVDSFKSRIKKYDVNHTLVLSFGSSGSGPGKFGSIGGIAIDQNDVLYVADKALKNVEKFDTNGTYIDQFGTVGSGDGQFQNNLYGIAIQPDGNVLVQDGQFSANTRLHILTPSGGFISTIPIADLRGFAQKGNGDITALAGTRFYTYQANGTAITSYSNSFSNPQAGTTFKASAGLAYDRFDNLYASGTDTARAAYAGAGESVARLNLDEPALPGYTSVVSRIANSGYGVTAKPYFTTSNQLLVPDASRNYVRSYNATAILQSPGAPINLTAISHSPGTIDTSWQPPVGSDPIISYRLEYKPHAYGQWIAYGNVTGLTVTIPNLVDDTYDIRVSATTEGGTGPSSSEVTTVAQASYAYENGEMNANSYIHGIAFDRNGKRYESNSYTDQIDVRNADGSLERSFSAYGTAPGYLKNPRGLAIGGDDRLYVADSYNDRVSIFNLDGTYISSFGSYGTGDGQFQYVYQVYIDSHDTVYVVDSYRNIQKFDLDGVYLGKIATDLTSPVSMVIDADENIYVANASYDENHGIVKYDKDGNRLLVIGSEGEADGQFYEVFGMVINPAGDLVISDTYNYRLQVFSPSGEHLTTIGRGYGNEGVYLTADEVYTLAQASNGDLYIPDAYSEYVHVLRYTGDIGTGNPPATTAPSEPRNVSATSPVTGTITTSWTTPVSNGGSALTQYVLEYKRTENSTWAQVLVVAPASTHTLTGLAAGSYDIRLSARNNVGTSNATPPIQVTTASSGATTTPPVTPPAAPEPNKQPAANTTPTTTATTTLDQPTPGEIKPPDATEEQRPVTTEVDHTTREVTVSWPKGASTPQPPTGYVIEYREAAASSWSEAARVDSSTYSAHFTVPSDGTYTVRVAAFFSGTDRPNIILGVSKITVSSSSFLPGERVSIDTGLPLWVKICSAGLLVAMLVLIPVLLWKRKKKRVANRL